MFGNLFNTPRYVLGSTEFFDFFKDSLKELDKSPFPPYNVRKIPGGTKQHTHYKIEIACAGYSQKDISITLDKDVLTVSSNKIDEDGSDYLYKSIAKRAFTRKFVLGGVKVTSATMKDGILEILLDVMYPKEEDVVKIPISDARELLTE